MKKLLAIFLLVIIGLLVLTGCKQALPYREANYNQTNGSIDSQNNPDVETIGDNPDSGSVSAPDVDTSSLP